MKTFRVVLAFGTLTGFLIGCSGSNTATKPANAPAVADEKPLPPPKGPTGAGPKQRPPG